MSDNESIIREINKLSIGDNDILLVKVKGTLSRNEVESISECLQKCNILKDRVLVVDDNTEFTKIEKSGYFEQYFKDHSK